MRNGIKFFFIIAAGIILIIIAVAAFRYFYPPPPVEQPPPPPVAQPVQPVPSTGITSEVTTFEPEIQKARDALNAGQFQNALETAREVLNQAPANSEAALIAFLSARMQNLPPQEWNHMIHQVTGAAPLIGLEHSNPQVQRYALWYLRQVDIPPSNKEVQQKVVGLYHDSQAFRKVRLEAGSTLATWGHNEFIQILLKDLSTDRSRYRAYISLKSIPDSFLPELAAMHENLSTELRAYTTCLLFTLGKPTPLKEMIIEFPEKLASLEDYIIPTEHPDFIRISVKIGEQAQPFARQLLEHKSYLVRAAGASILGEVGTRQDTDFLHRRLGRESGFHFVQGNIVEALGKLGCKPAVPVLIRLVGARSEYLRERVILALAELVDETDIDQVKGLIKSRDLRVSEGARRVHELVLRKFEEEKRWERERTGLTSEAENPGDSR